MMMEVRSLGWKVGQNSDILTTVCQEMNERQQTFATTLKDSVSSYKRQLEERFNEQTRNLFEKLVERDQERDMPMADMAQVMVSTRKFDSRLTKKVSYQIHLTEVSLFGCF